MPAKSAGELKKLLTEMLINLPGTDCNFWGNFQFSFQVFAGPVVPPFGV